MKLIGLAPLLSVLASAPAMAQSLTVGPEVLLTDVAKGPIEEGSVSATRGAGQALVTWTDYGPNGAGTGDVLGRLMNDDGTTIDVPIAVGPVRQGGPAAAFDGTRYLVTWSEGWTNSHPDRFAAAFVSAQGTVSTPFALVTDPPVNLELPPRLAYGSGVFFVAYGSYDNNHMIDGLLVDATGGVTPTPRFASDASMPRVASDGTGFLLTSGLLWGSLHC